MIAQAYELGLRHFGENYLQEAIAKRPACPQGVQWHFIGRIQSNKAAKLPDAFAWVDTVDTIERVKLLSKGASRCGKLVNVLIQVNIAREPQKAGVLPENLDKLVKIMYALPGVRFRGLMTMGPNLNAEAIRPYFRRMRELMDGLPLKGADCLSMGMSGDFEVAIQEGATHVRIGTALFGRRKN